jgi:thiamine pyrophosphokinase
LTTVLVFPGATAALVRAHAPPGARVVAVDGGADAARAAGVRVDLLVGDLDSVTSETLAALEADGVPIERHPEDKRDTDGALALRHAAKDDEVLFLGAGGGRPDHALASLHHLARAGASARAWAIDAGATTWVVTPDRPLRLDLPAGALLSALPFGGRVEGVTYDGLRWPLVDATMETGDPYGVSNECLAPPQRVSVRRGTLLVIRPAEATGTPRP